MKFDDLEWGYFFVCSSPQYSAEAYVSRSTGAIFVCSDLAGIDELPDDLDESDDYLAIPHKNDLDLGVELVELFVDQYLPDRRLEVQEFFSRKGAYSRFKNFLEGLDLLEKWYKFEESQTQRALLAWCRENNLEVDT